MIIVFTGNGKGKTTAALGQAIRALGEKKKAIMLQFIKGPWISGEDKFFAKNSLFKIIKGGKGFVGIMNDRLPRSIHKKAAEKTLNFTEKIIKSKKYDLVILDEINVAISLKLINKNKVLKILKNLPPEIDLILTGRNAPKEFIKLADIATEMKEIKYKKREAKTGIEY